MTRYFAQWWSRFWFIKESITACFNWLGIFQSLLANILRILKKRNRYNGGSRRYKTNSSTTTTLQLITVVAVNYYIKFELVKISTLKTSIFIVKWYFEDIKFKITKKYMYNMLNIILILANYLEQSFFLQKINIFLTKKCVMS